MTTNEIDLAIGLALAAAVLLEFIRPTVGWVGRKFFAWTLSFSARRTSAFYRKIALHDTSITGVMSFMATAIFGQVALVTQRSLLSITVLVAALAIYGAIGFGMSLIRLTLAEGLILQYQVLRAHVRPVVDESFLILMDSRFTDIRAKADYDAIIDALVKSPQTHPRSA